MMTAMGAQTQTRWGQRLCPPAEAVAGGGVMGGARADRQGTATQAGVGT